MNNKMVVKKVKEIMYEEMGVEPRIKVFAFGGAGGRMAEYIASKGIAGVKVIAVNVDEKVGTLNVDKKLLIGKEVLGIHRDTVGESRVAEYAVGKNKKWILDEVDSADAVVLIGAMGGGMGTGGLLETMRIIRSESRKPMMSFVILPFSAEKERRARAMETLNTLKNGDYGTYFVFDSDELLKNSNMSIFDAYKTMYQKGARLVRELAEFTGQVLKEKFEALYLSELPSIVESKANELEIDTIYA